MKPNLAYSRSPNFIYGKYPVAIASVGVGILPVTAMASLHQIKENHHEDAEASRAANQISLWEHASGMMRGC